MKRKRARKRARLLADAVIQADSELDSLEVEVEGLAVSLLAPMLRELHERHPEIMIELDDSQPSNT